jgi:hypothetical protein
MAHYALLNKQKEVLQVIVGTDEDDLINGLSPEKSYSTIYNCIVKRTSYNTYGGVHYQSDNNTPSEDQNKAFRKNYAGIGYTYDEERDAFIPPKQYPSWVLNEDTCLWESPIPYPNDGNHYIWDEETLSWVIFEL